MLKIRDSDSENINIKLLRIIIGNQIEIVNENNDIKNDKDIKGINNKKLIRTIIKRLFA